MNDFVALPFQVPQAQDLLHHAFSNRPNIITNSPESIPHIIRMAPPDPLPADPRVLAAAVPRSKNWPWYQESIGDKLTPTVRVLLEDYSGIPSEDVESHVYQIRDLAWEIFPWPCVGEFWFIALGLSTHPLYPSLLTRLQSIPTARFLDLGTCLGQDLRKLVFDGALPTQLHGSDVFPEYEDAGFALWHDKHKFSDRFIAADVFATDSALAATEGTWDIVSIFMFLHVWDLADQKRACRRILKLLKPQAGSWIIGGQTGSLVPREFPLRPPFVAPGQEKSVYRHNVETFREMWELVGREEGIALSIWVEYEQTSDSRERGGGKMLFGGDDNRRFYFLIKRL